MEEKRVKNLVLGGGLSGLSFAYYSQSDYLILEKEDMLGGYCKTIPNDHYVWDYAGHFYHFRTEKYKKLFLDLVEKDEIIVNNKNTKIYFNNKLIEYPFQTHIHQLDKDDFIDCLYDLFTKDETRENDNFLDMLYSKFGKSITEKFLRPYNEKLYATDLRELDVDAMGRFFPYADKEAIIRNMKNEESSTYNDTFMYLKKGTGYFIDKIADTLDQDKIMKGECVQEINTLEKYVITQKGEKIYYNNLISSIPLRDMLKIMKGKENINLQEDLSYNKVLVFNIGFNKKSQKYKEEHWVYFPDKELNFYRIGFYDNILGKDKLNIYVEIGYPKTVKADDIDYGKELQKTINGLKKVGIIDDSFVMEDYCQILMDPAYVHIKDTEHIDKIIKDLEKQNIYCLGRYGRWTYNSMEDCISLADELANKLKK